jgi:ABC-type amino acid transport substrate-binding protein
VAAVRRAGVLRVASDLSDPPLAFRQQGGPAGYEMDLAELLAQALGVRLAVADTPRALVTPGFENADLLIGGWTADHAPGLPSRPYYIVRQALVWRGARTPSGALPLRGLRVAAAAESAAASLAAGLGASPVLLTYRPDEALRAVARGAVDVAVCDEPLALEYARTIRGLHTGPAAGDEVPLVVLARDDAPDLAAFASAVIEELARTNGLARLRQRWRL